MSPRPKVALPATDRLRGLVLDASHILHIPTYIDALVGDYRRSVDSNDIAIATDDKYFIVENTSILYTGYRVYYILAKLYSAMIAGRRRDTLVAAEKIEQIIDTKLLSYKSPNIAD